VNWFPEWFVSIFLALLYASTLSKDSKSLTASLTALAVYLPRLYSHSEGSFVFLSIEALKDFIMSDIWIPVGYQLGNRSGFLVNNSASGHGRESLLWGNCSKVDMFILDKLELLANVTLEGASTFKVGGDCAWFWSRVTRYGNLKDVVHL